MTDDRPYGADDVAGTLYDRLGFENLRSLMTGNIRAIITPKRAKGIPGEAIVTGVGPYILRYMGDGRTITRQQMS
jgi:hypothetical protein